MKILIFYVYNTIKNFSGVSRILKVSVSYVWREIMKTKKNPEKIARKIAEMEMILRYAIGEQKTKQIIEKYRKIVQEELENKAKELLLPTPNTPSKEIEVSKVNREDLYHLRKYFYEKAEIKESIAVEAEYALIKKLLLKNTRDEIKLAMSFYIDAEKYEKRFSLKDFCSRFQNYYIPVEKFKEAKQVLNIINEKLKTKFLFTARTAMKVVKIIDKFGREEYLKAIDNLIRKIYDTRESSNPFTAASIRIDLLTNEEFIDNLLNYKSQESIKDIMDRIETEMIKKKWGMI